MKWHQALLGLGGTCCAIAFWILLIKYVPKTENITQISTPHIREIERTYLRAFKIQQELAKKDIICRFQIREAKHGYRLTLLFQG